MKYIYTYILVLVECYSKDFIKKNKKNEFSDELMMSNLICLPIKQFMLPKYNKNLNISVAQSKI